MNARAADLAGRIARLDYAIDELQRRRALASAELAELAGARAQVSNGVGNFDGREPDPGVVAAVLDALPRAAPVSGNALAARLQRRKQHVHQALRHLEREGAARQVAGGWEPAPARAAQTSPQLPIPTSKENEGP